jgi:hypothetical protein
MKHLSIITIMFVAQLSLAANTFISPKPNPRVSYIERYLDIAKIESNRSGIPVSIILSQGILESGTGSATLAVNGNNHFGIKCGNEWIGESLSLKDDDRDENGNLIESCFRAYESAENSYIDHTDFLMSRPRYEFLFSITDKNYREWAHGLKRANYATDSAYAYKLIAIIEKHKLYEYDGLSAPIQEETSPFSESIFEDSLPIKKKEREESPLAADELFIMETGNISKEQNIDAIKVDAYEPPKAYQIPKDYVPFNRKRFNDFFKKTKSVTTTSNTNMESEELEPIVPQDELRAKGVAFEKKYEIIRERQVKLSH